MCALGMSVLFQYSDNLIDPLGAISDLFKGTRDSLQPVNEPKRGREVVHDTVTKGSCDAMRVVEHTIQGPNRYFALGPEL